MTARGSLLGAMAACIACSRGAGLAPAGAEPHEAAAPAPRAAAAARLDNEPPTIGIDSLLPAGSRPDTKDSAGPPSAMATMKLLDPGQAPRRQLRYTWNLHQKELLAVELRTSASTEAGGDIQPEILLPPVHIDIAVDPKEVTPEGDLRYAWRVVTARITSDVQVPEQVAEGMRASVSAIDRLQGTATVTQRGLSKDIAMDPSSFGDAGAAGQMIEQVRQTLRDVAAPLPDEPVGRGARWEKHSLLDAKETRISQTETFTLLELEGHRATLDDVLSQSAPPQPLHAAGMRSGAQARMESMLASGTARVHLDLVRLVPQTKFDGTTSMVVSGQSAGDAPRRVTMVMRVGIAIQGTTRGAF